MEFDFSKSVEIIKYLIPALGVLFTLLIPKVWDWWRESSKSRYENQKIIKKSLFHLLRILSILYECKFYLSVKGYKIDYGLYIFLGEFEDQTKADALMSEIMKDYRQTLDQIKCELDKTCNELSTVEPHIAHKLSILDIDPTHAKGELRKRFNLPFLIENVLADIDRYRREIEFDCQELASLLDRKTKKETTALIEIFRKEIDRRIEERSKWVKENKKANN